MSLSYFEEEGTSICVVYPSCFWVSCSWSDKLFSWISNWLTFLVSLLIPLFNSSISLSFRSNSNSLFLSFNRLISCSRSANCHLCHSSALLRASSKVSRSRSNKLSNLWFSSFSSLICFSKLFWFLLGTIFPQSFI